MSQYVATGIHDGTLSVTRPLDTGIDLATLVR